MSESSHHSYIHLILIRNCVISSLLRHKLKISLRDVAKKRYTSRRFSATSLHTVMRDMQSQPGQNWDNAFSFFLIFRFARFDYHAACQWSTGRNRASYNYFGEAHGEWIIEGNLFHVPSITLCNKFEVKKKYKTYKTCFGVRKVCWFQIWHLFLWIRYHFHVFYYYLIWKNTKFTSLNNICPLDPLVQIAIILC